jgi:hypothetical protein
MIEGCAREVVDEPKLRAPVRLNRVGGGRIRGQATACLTRRIPRSMHTACGRRASQFSMGHRQVNIFSCDPGLDGAGAILDERGDFIACCDLPTIREGTQRRVDAANLADLIRSGIRDDPRRHRRAGNPRPPSVAGEVEKGAWP